MHSETGQISRDSIRPPTDQAVRAVFHGGVGNYCLGGRADAAIEEVVAATLCADLSAAVEPGR